ncbi:putative integral membrane protein (TIGR00698 family) [Saccharothrix australiensis]|uniref:Putative integral membrane protein (TIGR00698 family) n=1 Tax=Saccharothrix australiensis TaxID=2072 RepID=A0A495W8U1_9PSEU|nr:putative sulfate exporter family transporter [Saccharothrix australiensis]RKT57165.1 putative integral membrane protein (TIGR00698 family) [Saccharothrix australiensis]
MVLIAALVLGVLVGGRLPDLAPITRRLLRAGVVLLGLQLSLPQLLALGPGILLAAVVTVGVTFAGTVWLGRCLGLPRGLCVLVAGGFSICGASAIAAVASERDEEHVATGVALVTLFGTLTMIALPLLGASPEWIGLSVHEVAQVAAAAPAGGLATAMAVKLSRVALLAPVAALANRRRGPVVPLFLLGFLAMVAVRSADLLPPAAVDVARTSTTVLFAAAMFGLGTAVRPKSLLATGPRALLLGLLATLLVCSVGYLSLRVV